MLERLKISEVFFSLQGEGTRSGLPTVFVRLTGCPLRCTYCDTEYAFHGGEWNDIDSLIKAVSAHPTKHICVTGGEPLAQKNCLVFLRRLCDEGLDVALETSGALPIADIDARVSRIVDIKTPGSGEVERNHWANLADLRSHDEIKFVLTGPEDYQWAVDILRKYSLSDKCSVLFSPAHASLAAADLAGWILRDGLPVRMQMQLHKVLWGNERGR